MIATLTIADIEAAAKRLSAWVRCTPVIEIALGTERVLLKLENRQRTRSFKFRGALNAVLGDPRIRRAGSFITASAGNHGLGCAAAARLTGTRVRVVVPRGAGAVKRGRIARLGGDVVALGRDYDEAEELARGLAAEEGLPFIGPCESPLVFAGQGTVALEVLRQVPDIELLLAPVGGGGLLSGCAVAVKSRRPEARVVGVQTEGSPAMARSLAAGAPVETPIGETICDGLAGRRVTEFSFALVGRHADGVAVLPERAVVEAMRLVLAATGMVIEPSAAVGLAAVLEGAVAAAGRTVAVVTGGNIGRSHFGRIVGAGADPLC